jgi:large subunit ribosomal protein L23
MEMKKDPHQILIRPLLTEKITGLREKLNKIGFLVDRSANKIEVKQAAEEVLKVRVEKVHIVNVKGKKKRLGRHEGRRPHLKKAILSLKEGERVDLFEGV